MVDQVTDGKITEDDDDEELIPGETPPEESKEDKAPPAADDHDDDHEDDDDGEDTRLGASEEDSEDEIVSANRKRRKERNEARKRARDRTERELREMRELNNQLMNRLSAVETNTLAHNETALEQQLAAVQREIAQTEIIIAKATEAGNGEDVVTAMRLREEAMGRAQQLNYAKQQVAQVRQQPQQQQQAPNPQVVNYARQWMEANPWYNPASNDEASRVTTQIDAQIVRDGYDPASVEYWQELTRRVGEQLADDDDDTGETRRPQRSESPRRKAPPTGGSKEHAPVSTRKEIYVTPERKQAMVDAGIWDDPARRNRMLKQYQAYDRENRR